MKMKEGYQVIRNAVIGPIGNGKTQIIASFLRTLAVHFSDAVVQVVNTEGADAIHKTALHEGAEPSKPGTREKVTVKFHKLRLELEIFVWPGEDLLFERGIDVPKLRQQLEAEDTDLRVMAINPFQHDSELSAYSLLELCWNIQQKTGLSLGSACQLASKLLFFSIRDEDLDEASAQAKSSKNGYKRFADLRQLKAGFQDITDAQLRDGRLWRAPDAKLGLPLLECFRVDGCDDGPHIVKTIIRSAHTVGSSPLELLNMRGNAEWRPEHLVVAGVRADLLKFLPGVGEREFTKSLDALFPDPKRVTLGQIIPQASLDLDLATMMTDKAWLKNASDRAKPLIDAILNRCELFAPTVQTRSTPFSANAQKPTWLNRLSHYFALRNNHKHPTALRT